MGNRVFALLVLFALAGCAFGANRSQGVIQSYKNGIVTLRNGSSYRVGELPEEWRRLQTQARTIAFYHREYHSTIFTNAFCDRSYEDLPHEVFISRMVGGLHQLKTLEKKEIVVGGRGGLQKRFQAEMDGLPVELLTVVVKKNLCSFDFVAVMPPDHESQVEEDFTHFYNGFEY